MDKAVRGTDVSKQIRFFAVDATQTVREATDIHNLSITARTLFGRVIAAAIMLGIDLKGETDSVTLRVMGDGPIGGAMAIAHRDGRVKGYVDSPEMEVSPTTRGVNVPGALGSGVLRVIKDLGMERSYSGEVELISGEIGDDLAYFFLQSEQIHTAVGVGVLLGANGEIRRAGGFIVQLLPGAEEEIVARLEQNLAEFPNFTDVLDMGVLLEDIVGDFILKDLGANILDTIDVHYQCDCSRSRYQHSLKLLGKDELSEMIANNEPIIAQCHFCNKKYEYSPAEIQELLATM